MFTLGRNLTIDNKGDAYMPTANPTHKIPIIVSCLFLSWIDRSVIAITDPGKTTLNMPTIYAVLT